MQPLLEMKDITKIYPNGVAANEGACFSLAEGEIHAVAGENGAGKSTLMKMLSGAEKPTSGEIFFRGERVNFRSAKDAQALGIGMVWQHFMLVNEFPVYRNIFLGCEDCGKLGFLREKKMRVAAEELAGKYDMAVDIRAKCGDLPVGQAQKVEILKVLARGAKVLILDEPTAVLTPQETEELFRQLLLLKEDGCSIVIITHKLREIKRLCDRVTVMRAGRTLGTYDVSEVTEEDISRLMVGSSVKTEPDKLPFSPGEEVANVSDLHISGRGGKEAVSGVFFAVHRGEILGLAGVEGNGQKEAAEVLCGLIRKYRGLVTVEGQELAGRSVRRIRALGVAHIPEDRLRTGCDPDGSIFDNLIALCCDSESRLGFLREKRLKARVKEVIGRYSVKGTPGQKMCSLSGGNMQKVIVARELEASPVLLVADQPTRGVDIGSIAFIHQKLTELRDRGGAVLLVSADMSEMFALSDRILVFHGGEIVAEITDVQGTSEEQLGRYMLGIDRMEVTHG